MRCQRVPGTQAPLTRGEFVNRAHNVPANPPHISTPSSVDELAAIAKEADANQAHVRAVASGWSFNNRFRADIESEFRGTIDRWRESLVQLSKRDSVVTFDNDFCMRHGLEPFDAVGRL